MSGPDAAAHGGATRAELVLRVARAQAGDRHALDQLLRDHQEPLYRHLLSITGNRDLAFDALQNSLLLVARRLGGLRDPRWFKAWAYRIATREAVRTLKRESRFDDRRADAELADHVETTLPDEHFDAREIRACIDHLVGLPPACQIVVRLHYLEEMTFVEIAEALEIPVGTVKSRLAYGLARLRTLMLSG